MSVNLWLKIHTRHVTGYILLLLTSVAATQYGCGLKGCYNITDIVIDSLPEMISVVEYYSHGGVQYKNWTKNLVNHVYYACHQYAFYNNCHYEFFFHQNSSEYTVYGCNIWPSSSVYICDAPYTLSHSARCAMYKVSTMKVIHTYPSLALFITGVLLNTLIIIVLRYKGDILVTNSLLQGLAVWDILCLIFRLAEWVACQYSNNITSIPIKDPGYVWLGYLGLYKDWKAIDHSVYIFDLKNYIVKYWFYIISLIFQFCSVYQTLVIAVFRFAAIYWPFKATKYLTNTTARLATSSCLLIAVAVHLPAILHGVMQIHTKGDVDLFRSNINNTEAEFYPYMPSYLKDKDKIQAFFHGYHMIFYHILVFLAIPFCILLTLNVLLLRELYMNGSRHKQENNAVTKVVVALITVFLLSYSVKPLYMIDVHWLKGQMMNRFARSSCGAYFTVSVLIQVLPLLNSTVNFLLYFGLRPSFRQQFYSMFSANIYVNSHNM